MRVTCFLRLLVLVASVSPIPLPVFGQTAAAFLESGDRKLAAKNYDGAIADLTRGIELDPKLAAAYTSRGNARYDKGDLDGAIADSTRAIELAPKSAPAHTNRGIARYRKGDLDGAILDYTRAIELAPKSAPAYINRGNARRVKGDLEGAIADYTRGIELNPGRAQTLKARGSIHFYLGEFAAAQDDLRTALRSDPTDSYAAIWLYLAQARDGDDTLARGELAKNTTSLNLAVWPGAVITFYLSRSTDSALLSSANNSDTKKDREQHCEVYFYLGEYAMIRGYRNEAMHLFQQAIETAVTNFVEYTGAQVELKRF